MADSLRHVLSLSDQAWVRLERHADRFEDDWRRGRRPEIADYLPPDPGDARAVLIELVHADLEFRIGAGEPARVEGYLERFPGLGDDGDEVWDLIACEFRLRQSCDPAVGLDEYAARFPRFRDRLDALRAGPHAAPARLGKFELREVVGRGAFGVVYRAWDTERGRAVALKVLRADVAASLEDAGRFHREARSVAALAHPNIVAAYESGWAGETYYLASEFIPGTTLAARASSRDMTPEEAAATAACVAEALDFAHRQGVVHRDLKPSNILIDLDGRPHVTDFGLAKTAGVAEDHTLTRTGQVLGTPAYMSPEQARGQAGSADRRSDVYSLGVVLYQLLTGELPFRGNARMVLHQVLHDDPRPPRAVDDRVPRALETVCLKAMAKEPRGRYPTAQALADDLRRFLGGVPVRARPEGRWGRAARRARARPGVAALVALVAVVATAGAAGVVWQWRRAEAAGRVLADKARSETRARESLQANLYSLLVEQADREVAADHFGRAGDLLGQCPEAQRGWEWRHLSRLRRDGVRRLRGHDGLVLGLAFRPDGRRLAAAGGDGTVRVWDTDDGRAVVTFRGHTDPVHGVAFRPDGRRIASGGGGGMVKIWDAETGREVRSFRCHQGAVLGLAFGPDGRRLATAGGDGAVRIWDPRTGRELRSLRGQDDIVFAVAFSPDGRSLASAGITGAVELWDAETGRLIHDLRGPEGAAFAVAFSPDGRRVASAGGDGTVQLWDAATGLAAADLRGRTGATFAVAFSPDGRRVASAGAGGRVNLWDPRNGREVHSFGGHQEAVWAVAFSPDGRWLASADGDGWVVLRDAAPPASEAVPDLLTLRAGGNTLRSVAFSPDGASLASAGGGGTVRVWDVDGGRVKARLRGHIGVIHSVTFGPDGSSLASAGGDGTARVWDLARGGKALVLRAVPLFSVSSVAYGPDGLALASAGDDGVVRIWDPKTGRLVRALDADPRVAVSGVAFSPDGRSLASAGGDGAARVWVVSTGFLRLTIPGHTGPVRCVTFSPDGRRIASAGEDARVVVCDAATGRPVLDVRVPDGMPVTCLAFRPDGRQIATADGGGAVRLWDAADGRQLASHRGHSGAVYGVAFSPDGRRVASCGWDRTIRVWDLMSPASAPAHSAPRDPPAPRVCRLPRS